MPTHYFDTSAFAKRYHPEPGTPAVNALIAGPGPHLIPRLGVVELHSMLAKKVRTGSLHRAGFPPAIRSMRSDIAAGRVAVEPMTRRDYARAARLIRWVGLRRDLRSLDALQLAVALRLLASHPGLVFVSADLALLGVAAAHGLTAVPV